MRRTWLSVGLAALCVAVAVPAQAWAATSGATAQRTVTTAARPVVNMEATVKAAQIDPRRADDTLTPGAKAGVLLVEQALRDRHLLDAKWVDGYFGTTDGLRLREVPEVARLHRSRRQRPAGQDVADQARAGRFTVTHIIAPGARVPAGGVVVNTRTRSMLAEAKRLLGRDLMLSQGSYNPGGDPTSAGTHDGGGVVDISVEGMSPRHPYRGRPRVAPGRLRGLGAQPRARPTGRGTSTPPPSTTPTSPARPSTRSVTTTSA